MISLNGIGQLMVTMREGGANVGAPCKLTGNQTVSAVSSGESFHGICVWQQGDIAGVQIQGFVTMSYTGIAPTLGYCQLVGNGSGGVTTGTSTVSRLVAAVDTTNKLVTFYV